MSSLKYIYCFSKFIVFRKLEIIMYLSVVYKNTLIFFNWCQLACLKYYMWLTFLVMKQFISCNLSYLIYWNLNVSAFTAAITIYLTNHQSGVNTELTLHIIYYWSKISSFFLLVGFYISKFSKQTFVFGHF